MYRFKNTFSFPVRNYNGTIVNIKTYDAELLIRNASDGKKYLYDIVNIKENTVGMKGLLERETRSEANASPRHNVSENNIPQSESKSNGVFSERDAIKHRDDAKEHFGVTDDFKVAGYLTTDGSLLDFSGAHWLEGYDAKYIADWKKKNDLRQVDHEDIFEVIGTSGDNRLIFVNEGNIRLSPEAPGLELSSTVEPNADQYDRLRDYFEWAKNNYPNGTVYIDTVNKQGNIVARSTRSLNEDIVGILKQYYKTGKFNEASSLAQFRYSERDVEKGININDSTFPFTDEILKGNKTIETRDSRSLDPYIGKRVGIVRTGVGKATLVGYATIGNPVIYRNNDEFDADYDKHLVDSNNPYYIKPGQVKYGYPLTGVESTDAMELTSKGIVSRGLYSERDGMVYSQITRDTVDYLVSLCKKGG